MKSTSGEHFIALDHVRAVAAFLVFAWHFTHGTSGFPVPFDYVPSVSPLCILNEGHTGVALFMTLSGYLFARLLESGTIRYKAFVWNRVLRLCPLLVVVILIVGVGKYLAGENLYEYAGSIAKGLLLPTLPNGGWSITAEFHYYLVLPLFLWMVRRSRALPLLIVAVALLLRALIYRETGEIQSLSYWSIVGRIDQFALGMVLCQFRANLAGRHLVAGATMAGFVILYVWFDLKGVFAQDLTYASSSVVWVFLPTLEGVAYAVAIAWYESTFRPSRSGLSGFIGRIGEYSYSIYLLHFFFVFQAARFVNDSIMNLSNFYVACFWSLVCFLLMMPIGHLSYRLIEAPFLKLRKVYLGEPHGGSAEGARSAMTTGPTA